MGTDEVLAGLGLDGTFSVEAVAKVNGAIEKLLPQAAKNKEAHLALQEKRQAHNAKIDELIAARHALQGNRAGRPGDVVATDA